MIKEDDLQTLGVDTDSHGNRWKPFREAVFESYTTTLSTWDLDAPLAAQDFCRHTLREYGDARRWFSDWKRNKQLDDNGRVCHGT